MTETRWLSPTRALLEAMKKYGPRALAYRCSGRCVIAVPNGQGTDIVASGRSWRQAVEEMHR